MSAWLLSSPRIKKKKLIPNTDELKNDIVKHSEREANEEPDEDLEDFMSDNESSCMEVYKFGNLQAKMLIDLG